MEKLLIKQNKHIKIREFDGKLKRIEILCGKAGTEQFMYYYGLGLYLTKLLALPNGLQLALKFISDDEDIHAILEQYNYITLPLVRGIQ